MRIDRDRALALSLCGLILIMPPFGAIFSSVLFGVLLFGSIAYAVSAFFWPKKLALLTARYLGVAYRWITGE